MEKAIKRYWPVFVLPTLAAFIIGFVWPFIQGLYLSFCKFITIDKASFNGLKNYIFALTEADFLHAFWFTALFTVVSTLCINLAALAIALALTREIKGTNLFVKQDSAYTAEGKTPVSWNFPTMPSENWKNEVGNALTAYAAGTGSWDAVVTAFVDGWASEYAALNG